LAFVTVRYRPLKFDLLLSRSMIVRPGPQPSIQLAVILAVSEAAVRRLACTTNLTPRIVPVRACGRSLGVLHIDSETA
jgi:hypothetical protein